MTALFAPAEPQGDNGSFEDQIEVIVDEGNKPWFKRAHVGKFLDIKHIDTSVGGLDSDEMSARIDLEFARSFRTGKFKGQPHDIFLSDYGVLHVIIGSRKPRGKEWIMRVVVPRVLRCKCECHN